jgi:hypothetical protein
MEMVLTSTAFRNAVSIFISYIIKFLKAGIAKIIRIDNVADTVVYTYVYSRGRQDEP